MKSFKRLVVFMLVLSMVIGTMVPAFAFADVEEHLYEDEINKLAAVGVVKGDENGFRPDDNITRAEVAVIICKMLGAGNTMDAQKNMPSAFSDVAAGEWYTGAINLATGNGIIKGFPDGTFKPQDNITVAQAVTLMVKALGRGAYVDAAGQWPANYIAEGAKLGVTANVVAGGQDDLATRGMVAAMAWNSLDIPVWDVYETTHKGEIVSSATDTMLALYFKDFVTKNGDLKWAEDIEVVDTYITRKDIASNQIVLNYADVQEAISGSTIVKGDFEAKAEDDVKNKEVKTYVDGSDLIVYVADENVSVATLANKEIDVMFGKDNIATLVIVGEDAETDVLVKYLAADKEIVVGSETYEIAKDDVEIIVNNEVVYEAATAEETEAAIAEIVTKVTETAVNNKTISKVIKVDVSATSGNKIEKLVFEVSGNFDLEFVGGKTAKVEVTQFIVKEIKNDKIKAIDASTDETINIDLDKLADEDDVITVIKDGEEVELADIAAGDVVTYTGSINDAAVMYVSSARVTGVVDKVKSTNEIVVAGESYFANGLVVGNLSNDIEKASVFETTELHNVVEEEVELYFNYLGEYVAVLTDAEGGEWNFGLVTKAEEDDDEDDLRLKLRILTEDGSKKSFYVVEEDEDVTLETKFTGTSANAYAAKGIFVAYKVTGENEIEAEDLMIINGAKNDFITVGDKTYSVIVGATGEGAANYDYEEIAGKDYNDETVVFDKVEEEIVDEFKSIVKKSDNSTIVDADDYVIFENKSNDIKFIVLNDGDEYLTSDSEYAYVTDVYAGNNDEWKVTLYVEGTELNVVATSKPAFTAGCFIKYALKGENKAGVSKLDLAADKTAVIADIADINGLADDAIIIDEVDEIDGIKILAGAYEDRKGDLIVAEIDGFEVKFDDDAATVVDVKLLKDNKEFDGVIYDLSGNEPTMVEDIAALDGEYIMAIATEEATLADIIIILAAK